MSGGASWDVVYFRSISAWSINCRADDNGRYQLWADAKLEVDRLNAPIIDRRRERAVEVARKSAATRARRSEEKKS